jgi:hypothetical protein
MYSDDLTPDQYIRGQLAAHRVFGYLAAARCKINPVQFSKLINGKARLTPALTRRIIEAIEQEAKERVGE